MFKFTRGDKRTTLEKEIDAVLEIMSKLGPETAKYSIMVDNLEKLYKAKGSDPKCSVSPDTIAVIAGNLLGIVLIIRYEATNVITTKALGFVLRGRV